MYHVAHNSQASLTTLVYTWSHTRKSHAGHRLNISMHVSCRAQQSSIIDCAGLHVKSHEKASRGRRLWINISVHVSCRAQQSSIIDCIGLHVRSHEKVSRGPSTLDNYFNAFIMLRTTVKHHWRSTREVARKCLTRPSTLDTIFRTEQSLGNTRASEKLENNFLCHKIMRPGGFLIRLRTSISELFSWFLRPYEPA